MPDLDEQSEVLDAWLKKNIESVKEIIKKEQKGDTIETETAKYPNIYGPAAFEATYLSVIEMLDKLYSLDPSTENYELVRREAL